MYYYEYAGQNPRIKRFFDESLRGIIKDVRKGLNFTRVYHDTKGKIRELKMKIPSRFIRRVRFNYTL